MSDSFANNNANSVNDPNNTNNAVSADNPLFGMRPNTYCMLIHLSQFSTFIVPLFGIIVPILLWLLNKDKNPMVDQHGKIVLNWMLSVIIYTIASILLTIVVIGIIPLIALVITGIVFPIIGAIKANDGIVWKYPLSIPFFK